MANSVVEQEQKQIPIEDIKEKEVAKKEVMKKDIAQDSGNNLRQSRSVEEICSDMLNLGVFPVENVPRVTIESTSNETVVISKPYVFKSPHSETYVILGAAANEPKEVDGTTGLNNNQDIMLVMSQAGVCRSKAVEALKANNGDIVSAIMALSS